MSKSVLFFKITLTALLLLGCGYLARVGIADFLRLEPCAYIESVQNGKEQPGYDRLIAAQERLAFARSWDTQNPVIPEYLGQVAVIRAQLLWLSPTMQAEFFHVAIAAFDNAIELRPNSAFLWADRMTVGSALLEANARAMQDADKVHAEMAVLSTAFLRASQLGPWEPKVLMQQVRVGMFRYQEFSPDMRAAIDAAIVRAKRLGLKV
jgi:hypothetical protein